MPPLRPLRLLRPLRPLLLLTVATASRAQSPSRDWRPEDRTVIGDFSRITSVATALDRVYVSSPAAVLIWNPQFHQWQGPYDPPDPALLTRVTSSLVDPLDNSLWLARPDGWVHFQPELQLWDQGAVPDGVQTIAFDTNDPTTGLYLLTRRGWEILPRGGLVALPARLPFGLRSPAVDAVLGWPDGVWAATGRTPQAEAALTFVEHDLRDFRSLQG